jgi:apolipoprotein N-acyltransferase
MNEQGRSRSEFIQGCVVLAVMLGLLGWVGSAVWHSDIFWLKVLAVIFVVMFALMGAFIAMMMIAQWLDQRRCAREGREWRP